MNMFRDLYTHFIWSGYRSRYPNYMVYLSVIVGGRYYEVCEGISDVEIGSFWKRDDYQVFRANKRWDLIYDDYDPQEKPDNSGSWYCSRCGAWMERKKYSENIMKCNQCYDEIKV